MNYDEVINNHTSQVQNDITQIKQTVQLTREHKEKMIATIKSMRTSLDKVSFSFVRLYSTFSEYEFEPRV